MRRMSGSWEAEIEIEIFASDRDWDTGDLAIACIQSLAMSLIQSIDFIYPQSLGLGFWIGWVTGLDTDS